MYKKLISLYLILILITSIMSSVNVNAGAESAVSTASDLGKWTDFAVEPDLSGTTYIIDNATELAWIAAQVNKGIKTFSGYTIKINENIECIDLADHFWVPIGNLQYWFDGIFDGSNKKILNLKVSLSSADKLGYVGFFGYVSSGTLKNIYLDNVDINSATGCYYVGGLAGVAENNSNIFNCCVTGNLRGQYNSGVGGLAGLSQSTICNCYFKGSINGSGLSFDGGLVGWTYSGSINNCYAIAEITAGPMSRMGGLTGMVKSSSGVPACVISNCYASCNLNGGDLSSIGGDIGELNKSGYYANIFWDIDKNQIINNVSRGSTEKVGTGYGVNYSTGKTAVEIKSSSFVADLNKDIIPDDILNTWKVSPEINEGYPIIDGVGEGMQVVTNVPVLSISLDKDEINLNPNGIAELTYYILPMNATNQEVLWSSSDESIVTIAGGTVYPHNPGTAQITVSTVDGNKQAYCTIVVNSISTDPVPVSSVSINNKEINLYPGETENITYTILPGNATNKKVSWIVEDNNQEIVNLSNGKVTALKPGTAIITVVTEDGNKQDYCIVNVVASTQTISCDNTDLLNLCKLTDEAYSIRIDIDFSDVEKKKEIFGLLFDEPLYYEIYYGNVNNAMLFQTKKELSVSPYSDSDALFLSERFKVNGKYIIKIFAGVSQKTVLVTVDINNKSSIKDFGHVNLENGEKVAIIPYDIINESKLSAETLNTLNEAKYCIEHYSLQDWHDHLSDYHKYDAMFPDGSFSNYLDARLKAQTRVVGNDLVGALRNASAMQLVAACNSLSSIVTGITPDELIKDTEAAKAGNCLPLADTINTVIDSADTFVNSKLKELSILDVLNIFNTVFSALGSFSDSYTTAIQASELEGLQNAFYNELECLLKDEFSDYPEVKPGQWLELRYHNDFWDGIVITEAKVHYDSISTGYSYTSNQGFVPANEKEFNEQAKIRDLAKSLMDVYPETFIYKYITLKTVVELHCPITVDVCKGETVVASIGDSEPANIINEYGYFCSYRENGELVKKVIMKDPELKLVIRGTATGNMDMLIIKNGTNGLFETTSAVKNVEITPSTIIDTQDIPNMKSLSIDENGDGTPDKQYSATEIVQPTDVSISKSSIILPVNCYFKLEYTVVPENVNADNGFTWYSGDNSIVSVDQEGMLRGNTSGETDVYLYGGNGLIRTCHVIVTKESDLAPIITIAPYITDQTNKDIIVTASASKGSLNAESHTFSDNGSFTFVATDESGYITEKTVTITNIDKIPPELTVPGDVTAVATGVYTPVTLGTASAFDLTDGVLNVTSNAPAQYPKGTTEVIFTAADKAGNTSQRIVHVTIANAVPVIETLVDKTVNEGDILEFTVVGNDPDGDKLTYSVDKLPEGAVFDSVTGALSWQPDYTQSGKYALLFSVSDGIIISSKVITITVNNVSAIQYTQNVISKVKAMKLNKITEALLVKELENIDKSLDKNKPKTALVSTKVFVLNLKSSKGRTISPENAANLLEYAAKLTQIIISDYPEVKDDKIITKLMEITKEIKSKKAKLSEYDFNACCDLFEKIIDSVK